MKRLGSISGMRGICVLLCVAGTLSSGSASGGVGAAPGDVAVSDEVPDVGVLEIVEIEDVEFEALELGAAELEAAPAPPAAALRETVEVRGRPAAAEAADDAADDAEAVQAEAPEGESEAEDGADEQNEDPPAPRANPLQNVIRGLFGGGRANPPVRVFPDDAEEDAPANGDTTARDPIDARAPHDPNQAKLLRGAVTAMANARASGREQDWRRAMDMLQRILERSEDSLIRLPDGRWVSIRAEANRLLGDVPPPLLEGYRNRNEGLARRMLADARRAGDLPSVVDVALQFLHTEAGQQAADHLGTVHFDRGEFGLAARWFRELLRVDAPLTRAPRWRLKAAFALRQAGDPEGAEELIAGLAPSGSRAVELGGKRVEPGRWFAEASAPSRGTPPVLDDWPMFFGNPSRTGTATGGEPLLLPRWSHNLTESRAIAEQVQTLGEDLADLGRAALPAFFPLTVEGRVAFRTLRGVHVVDAGTGRLLWETREGVSPERLLAGGMPFDDYAVDPFGGQVVVMGGMGMGRFASSYAGGNADFHPLTGLLFRDATWGILGSDGDQLFVLEDHALLSPYQPGYWAGGGLSESDPHRRDWSSNKIASYDLKTGRALWEIGGAVMDEPFDRRLAGQYFFGVPVAEGGDLFIAGEKDNEIRLFCLNRETGRERWSQLIAYSDARIEQDVGRRFWSAPPAVRDGVVVCPTTVGWLVGVDRLNRSLLWAYRFSAPGSTGPPRQRRGDFRDGSMVQNTALNAQWSPAPPVISGGRVVYTPPEETAVVCLDLYDGSLAWREDKGNMLYLAGVFDERVVLVGTNSVKALSLEDGSTLWSMRLPAETGKPSGYGVAVGDRYHLPLRSGELWTLDLADGKVVSRSWLRDDGDGGLGNLAMYRGMLLSLGPSGLTSFEQRDAIEAEIRRRQEANAEDAWALLREADMLLLNREHAAALELLRRVAPGDLEPEWRLHYRQAMLDSLGAVIRGDFAAHDEEFAELSAFVQGREEELFLLRLSAERAHGRDEVETAFELYLELAEVEEDRVVPRADDPDVTVPMIVWLAGRLEALWNGARGEPRARLDGRIAAVAGAALAGAPADREEFLALYGFHPDAVAIRRRMADDAGAGEITRAENLLLKLARHADREVTAAAVERLARLLADAGLPRGAAHQAGLLEQFGDAVLPDGSSAREAARRLTAALQEDLANRPDPSADWGDYDLQVSMTGMNYSAARVQEVAIAGDRLPFYRDHRFLFHQQEHRLAVSAVADESVHWLLPLRRDQGGGSGGPPAAHAAGHKLIVVSGDMVHCLAPLEKKVLWTRPLDARGHAAAGHRDASRHTAQPMQSSAAVLSRNGLRRQASQDGLLAVANAEYVCLRGRRSLTVRDTMTGAVRWTHERVPANAAVYGTQDVVLLVPRDGSGVTALRAIDGERLDVPDLADHVARAVHVARDGLVVVESAPGSASGQPRGRRIVVRLFDPYRQVEQWQVEFPGNTYFSVLEEGVLAALEPSGDFVLVDLETGREERTEGVSESEVRSRAQVFVLTDFDRAYLVVNQNRGRSVYYSSSGLSSLNANGTVHAFDRATGKRLWHDRISGYQLMREHFNHLPLLLFTSQKYDRQGNLGFWTANVLAIDKRTGRRLAESSIASYPNFQAMNLNLADRFVELVSYNHRIRMTAREREHAPELPVEAPAPLRAAGPASED